MSNRFQFDEDFLPVPPAAVDADPVATIKELLYRVACLEQSLGEQRQQAIIDKRDLLLALISLYDDITAIIGRWDLATKAQEAAVMGGVIALGKKLLAILQQHAVQAIDTIGKPFNPETSDIVSKEVRENAPPNLVLREVQTGYIWPHGLLRRAKVIVSAQLYTPSDKGAQPPADAA